MIPIRDDNPQVQTPLVTMALIAMNALTWVGLQGLGSDPALATSVCELGLIPGELLGTVPAGTRVPLGPQAACVLGGSNPHTLLTSMFMHGSWAHILGNMWFLWIFGDNVEDAMGHARFAAFYVLSGFAAAAAQMLANPASSVPMVGASGAIGGVMGAYIVLYPRVNVHMLVFIGFLTTVAVPAVFMLGYWLLVQLLGGWMSSSVGGGVAFWAHVGGFAAGAALIYPFRSARLMAQHPYHGWRRQDLPSHRWRRLR